MLKFIIYAEQNKAGIYLHRY